MKKSFFFVLDFLKSPVDTKETKVSITDKMKYILTIFILDVLIVGLLGALIWYLKNTGIITNYDNELAKLYDEHPAMLINIIIVLFAPLIEEFIFRFPLVFKRNYLLQIIISLQSGNSKDKKSLLKDKYRKIWDKYYFYIFYLSAIIFSLVHISNIITDSWNIFVLLLFISPQFILAVLLGVIRVKIGFRQAFLFHSVHNLIALSLSGLV